MRRTTATTAYLKECMGTALLELMKEKPIEKITIEEMTAKADVGRSTYFRYFKTKDEVLTFKIIAMWERFSKERDLAGTFADGELYRLSVCFFEFCLSNRAVSDLLFRAGHQNVILDAYLEILTPEFPDDYLKNYYGKYMVAYALLGLTKAWILREYRETPQEMAEIITQFSSAENGGL